MTLFSNEINLKGVGAILVSALVLFFTSCVEVDDTLGTNIIPPGQEFEVQFASLEEGIESYITYTDSISTGTLDYAYFGKMTDKHYGAVTRSSALVQFTYAVHSDSIAHKGVESMPDSMVLVAGMKTVGGDTLKEQTFDIYRLRELLKRDEMYYGGTDYEKYIDDEPLFSFTFRGKPHGANEFDTLSLHPTDAGRRFMEELWSVDTTYYSNDSLFLEQFKGFYITPSGSSPEDAAIYGMNLQWDTNDGPASYVVIYGHEYPSGGDESLVEDDVMRAFYISNNEKYTSQTAVTVVEHDYSAMVGGASINYDVAADEPLTNPVSEGYVQGFLGVTTTLELTEEFVASLRALCPEGRSIFINQARMYVDLVEDDYTYYDYAPARVGTYTNYAKLTAVPDYNYYYEENYETELLYGGYLNRTFGRYEMDLALYLQELLNDKDGEVSRRITLGMGAYEYMQEGMVKLSLTGSSHPVKFDITYTLIGK